MTPGTAAGAGLHDRLNDLASALMLAALRTAVEPRDVASALQAALVTTKSGGMGIGLFVSRSIVERHEGRMWAEPNEGPGASFSFSIPLHPAGANDAHARRTT